MRKRRFFDIESIFFGIVHLLIDATTSYFHYFDYIQESQSFFMATLRSNEEVREFAQEINIYWYFALAAISLSFMLFIFCFAYTFSNYVEPFLIVMIAMFQSICYMLIWKMFSVHRAKAQKLRDISPHAGKFVEHLDNFLIPLTIAILAFSSFTTAIYSLCNYIVFTKSKRIAKNK